MTERQPPAIDDGVPHSARVRNYLMGGKDHYQVDKAVGDQIIQSAQHPVPT